MSHGVQHKCIKNQNVIRLTAVIKQDGQIVKNGQTTCTGSVEAHATTELDCVKSSGPIDKWQLTAPFSGLQF